MGPGKQRRLLLQYLRYRSASVGAGAGYGKMYSILYSWLCGFANNRVAPPDVRLLGRRPGHRQIYCQARPNESKSAPMLVIAPRLQENLSECWGVSGSA